MTRQICFRATVLLLTLISLGLANANAALFAAEKPNPKKLTVQRIYGSKEFSSRRVSARWLPLGHSYLTFVKSKTHTTGRDLVKHDAKTGQIQVLVSAAEFIPPGQTSPLNIEGYTLTKDLSKVLIYTNSKRVWRRNSRGDYWILDRSARQLRKLGAKFQPSTLMFAKISPTGEDVAYVHERNIYVENLLDHSITKMTTTKDKHVINGTFDWVYEEELGLRDGFRWSPNGRSIAYWQLNTEGVQVVPLVNNTDSRYPRITWIPYPKTGQRNSACRVGVVSLHNKKTNWMRIPGDPRQHYIARMDWANNSHELIIQQLNRLQNTNKVMQVDTRSGVSRTILTERDKAWVDAHNEMKWLKAGKRFTWVSDRDGWRHAYLVSRDGKTVKQATKGKFDVIQLLHVDEKLKSLYFIASPSDATRRFLYRCNEDGTGLTRLTPNGLSGTHSYSVSPQGDWAIHTSSSLGKPPVTELIELRTHRRVRVLEENKSLVKKYEHLDKPTTEIFRVKIGGNVELDAWCIKPPGFDPKKKYPLIVYVYGEPAGQTVVDRWGGSSYLWHVLLAQRGYIVMSFDNRGTKAPRGRSWRKFIYRKIGIIAPQDQAAAVKSVLKSRSYIDSKRVGVWGWSGGGSSTLHAMFKYPDVYHTGIAIAPVPNQRYYDTIYQERYMGLPKTNVEGYRQGSPINFARQLKGNLLLVHGTGDDNCHYQTTEMLINELILHNKPFRMFAYPNRTHSIREGINTSLHLREMMTQFLLEKLPANSGLKTKAVAKSKKQKKRKRKKKKRSSSKK
jgi:dipeptidyl-peptidase 4